MSMRLLQELAADLPFALRDQVISYAESIERVLPSLFWEAGVKQRRDISDAVVFVAGVTKLRALTGMPIWAIESSQSLLERSGVWNMSIGSTELGRGAHQYEALQQLNRDLDTVLVETGVAHLVGLRYTELIALLSHDERSRG